MPATNPQGQKPDSTLKCNGRKNYKNDNHHITSQFVNLFRFLFIIHKHFGVMNERDLSCTSQHSSSSYYDDESQSHENEDQDQVDDDEVASFSSFSTPKKVKGVKNPKRTLLSQVCTSFVVFICAALILDMVVLHFMELEIKTIDVVLGYDNPDANINLSLDVSSRMLFSSIKVNSFDCDVSHQAPYDEDPQVFARYGCHVVVSMMQ